MSEAQHQRVAMRILTSGAALRSREGQFLGGIAFDANLLTDKQARWLAILEARYLSEASEVAA